jgi:Tol biopolymer transport system component
MHDRSMKAVLLLAGIVLALALAALAWTLGGSSYAAQQDGMHNCPQPGKWAISVWEGPDGTETSQALATCGAGAVDFAYSLDPGTNGWLGYFEGRPEVSKLLTLDNMQGIIAHGAVGAPAPTPTPTPTVGPQEGAMHNCPQAGKWAISVWSGADGTATGQALAACGPGTVDFAYSLDPGTNGWLGYFEGRPEVSKLLTLNNLQGMVAHGAGGGFSLAVDKFGEGTIASSPGGIDCGAGCTFQAAPFPPDSSVVLTATADPGSTFSYWSGCDSVSGDSCTVNVDGDSTVFATFALTELKLREGTKVLDEDTMGHLLRQEGSIYYFDQRAEAAAELQPGEVILSFAGGGLLRRVAQVSISGDEIAVDTTGASLEEAIERGTLGLSADLASASGGISELSLAGIKLELGCREPQPKTLIPTLGLVDEMQSGEVGVELKVSGSVSAMVDACVRIEPGKQEVRLVATLKPSVNVALSISGAIDVADREWSLPPIPPVCFGVVCLSGDVKLALELKAKAGGEVGFQWDPTVQLGFHALRSGGSLTVKGIGDLSSDFQPSLSPTLHLEGKVWLKFALGAKLFNSAGLQYSAGPYVRLDIAPIEVPWGRAFVGIVQGEIKGVLDILFLDPIEVDVRPATGIGEWEVWRSPTFLLKVDKVGNGTVTSVAEGINCGLDCDQEYNAYYLTSVGLTAKPDPGWQFSSWSGCDSVAGDTCTVTMTSDRSVTASFAQEASPTPTPTPGPGPTGRIAFTSGRDGNGEIYVMNADGSGQTNLTNNPAVDDEPAWSPDGSRIAFTRGGDVYVMNADGAAQTNLTNHPANDSWPAWSPDGTKIAFVSDRDGNAEIYLMNADGSSQRNLTDNSGSDRFPTWSPDGGKIAFMRGEELNAEVYTMNADGSSQRNLTNSPARGDYLPDWSPDGSKIAFSTGWDPCHACSNIWVMGNDGSAQKGLTDDGYAHGAPRWSPDGSQIAFVTYRDHNDEVYITSADGGDQRNLTKSPDMDYWPDWSPDGTKIAFESWRDGNGEIYVMDADGGGQTNVTEDPGNDYRPAWSP